MTIPAIRTVGLGLMILAAPILATSADDEDARIAATHATDRPVATPAAATLPVSEVTGEAVVYATIDGESVTGYLARPVAASDDRPALIVIHEWWGLNDNIRRVTDRLAGEGFTALAVDLYRGRTGATPKEAMSLMGELNEQGEQADANLRAAFAYLSDTMDAPRVGVIGWCLGGRWSLKTALLMPDAIDAMVMYYGSVVTEEAQLATLNMPVLGNFAENDPIIPLDQVAAFRETLKRLGKDVDVKVYAGTQHAFSNPSGMAYDPVAAEDAWVRSTTFLAKHLASE